MMRALTSQLQGLYGERRGAREVFEQWRTRSELGACFWVPDGNMIKAGSRSGQFYGIELTGFVLRAAAGGWEGRERGRAGPRSERWTAGPSRGSENGSGKAAGERLTDRCTRTDRTCRDRDI